MVSANVGITLMPELAIEPPRGCAVRALRRSAAASIVGMVWRTTTTREALLRNWAALEGVVATSLSLDDVENHGKVR